jgi:hypothetical protein
MQAAKKCFQNKEQNLKDEMDFSIHNLISIFVSLSISLSLFLFAGTVFIQFFVLHLAVNQFLSLTLNARCTETRFNLRLLRRRRLFQCTWFCFLGNCTSK